MGWDVCGVQVVTPGATGTVAFFQPVSGPGISGSFALS